MPVVGLLCGAVVSVGALAAISTDADASTRIAVAVPGWPSTELAFTALGATPSTAAFRAVFFLVACCSPWPSGGLQAELTAASALPSMRSGLD